jgi:TolB-like protein/Tfp pilus assembly protein PilF
MFTDITGYTAMMQTDEQDAIEKRKRHKKILKSLINKHQGKIVQYYGDGSLSIFTSAIKAANCAVDIQLELQKEPKIPLRIGIHTGDIVHDGDSIYGDGVNVASRVESLAVPGGVLVSDKVFDEIKNHPEFSVKSMGVFELKNVKKPVTLYALTNKGLAVPEKDQVKSNKKTPNKTIAVLPFLNMSADPENEYFSEGITEEIINVLAKVEGLNVTARTSSFAFKGKSMDVREIGAKLGVGVILEGSVRKAGNRVRITAQLIDTNDGFHIFSEDYDRDLKDIFALQDEIALLIANKLRENLEKPPGSILPATHPTGNLEAYDMYLKGRHHMRKGSHEGVKESIINFKKAIEMEPDFALPYTGLSQSYLFLGASRLSDQEEALTKAKTYALTAQKLDDNLAETHMALARIHFWNDWDMKEAKKAIRKALRLGSGSADIHGTYSFFLLAEGKLEEALVEAHMTMSLDPLSPISNYVLGTVYYGSERFAEAIEQYEKTLEKMPNFQQAYVLKAKSHLCAGEPDNALETYEKIPDSPNIATLKHVASALAHSKKGEIDKVYLCLETIKEKEKAGSAEFLNWSYTLIYMALDEIDKMFYYLEKSLNEKTATLLFIRADPLFKKFRKDPRFIDLIDKTFG